MKTLAVVSQKGGSGKSTLSVHLAACAAAAGKAVALIDIDKQGSSFSWFRRRNIENELAATKAKAEELPALLKKLKAAKADLVIIDTAPKLDREAAAVVGLADFVLVPSRPSSFDIEAVAETMDIIKGAKNPPPHAIIINAAKSFGSVTAEAKEALSQQGYSVMKSTVFNRVAFDYAVTEGRSVQEFEPYGKAAAEIEALFNEISAIMEI